jgi:hypothetical protein
MASGAITPGAAAIPVQPIVNTRKNVPMNSTAYRRIARPFALIVDFDCGDLATAYQFRQAGTSATPVSGVRQHDSGL